MRRMLAAAAALMLALFLAAPALAEEAPGVSLTEAFIEAPDAHPRRVLLEEGRLRVVVDPGSTVYFPIEHAQRAEDFSGLRAVVVWSKGAELAANPRIEYRQMYDEAGAEPLGYRYVVVLSPLDGGVSGTMQGEVKVARRQNSPAVSVAFTISVKSSEEASQNLYRCGMTDLWVDFSGPSEWTTIEFYDRARFVVPSAGQQSLNIGCSIEPLTDFLERYPDASMRFLCWKAAPIFNYAGTLLLFAEPDEFLYRIIPGGLVDCTGQYAPEEGGFVLETRQLGEFVISDRPLDPDAAQQGLANPPVGAQG